MIFGVERESEIVESLAELGLTTDDINGVLMTHMHFDHATGLTVPSENGEFESVFKKQPSMFKKLNGMKCVIQISGLKVLIGQEIGKQLKVK